jgi:hypothetical protein
MRIISSNKLADFNYSINNLFIEICSDKTRGQIYFLDNVNKYVVLGEYPKERALEVMGLIRKAFDYLSDNNDDTNYFYMPKE